MHFHIRNDVHSWGRIGRRVHHVARPRFAEDIRQWNSSTSDRRLAVGKLRSYSDVCLFDGGRLVDMTGLNRFLKFDPATGILVAEAGVTIDAVLSAFVPRGFFVPVTPGTRFVTLGGAVANDVHGKNHHRAGTFGRHVRSLVLERSDEGSVRIGPDVRPDLFSATVGGLGLTGIVTEVELQLQRINSSRLSVETAPCGDLETLCDELDASERGFEHVVAWIDCTATCDELGRGIVSRANWLNDGSFETQHHPRRTMPTDRLDGLLNPVSLAAFNRLCYAKGQWQAGQSSRNFDSFLYPLDSILHWNRLYGRSGFFQYQCVIPDAAGREPVRQLLAEIAKSREGSFLAVLKRFGDLPSPGMLSFPVPGLTLALDFRNRGEPTLALLARLDSIVEAAGGRLYAAKDMRVPAHAFTKSYPAFESFRRFVDPNCRSDFWEKLCS